jgi:voltage-gated potassium channel Kch
MGDSVPDNRPVIVAGLGRLGLRLVLILRGRGAAVRVITDGAVLSWHERQAQEAGAEVFHGDFRDPEVWLRARVEECQAAVVTSADDSRNLETSIRIKCLAPELRMVTRVDAPHLGHRLQEDFGLAAALCPATLCAGRFVKVALEASVAQGPRPARRPLISGRRRHWQKLVLGLLVGALLSGTLVFHFGKGLPWLDAVYFTVTILTTVGFGDYDFQGDPAWLKVFGMLAMLSGITLIALLVSLFGHFLITGEATRQQHDRAARRQRRHVIVAGMGSLGHAAVRELRERGEPLVCVERDPDAAAAAAHQHRVTVITGDAMEAETLLRAGLDRARAVLAVTSSDGVNLEIALRVRTLADVHLPAASLPVIISCQDELLADRLRSANRSYYPLSTAEIAAPVLAAAALGEAHGHHHAWLGHSPAERGVFP